jgi:hypothetical protein
MPLFELTESLKITLPDGTRAVTDGATAMDIFNGTFAAFSAAIDIPGSAFLIEITSSPPWVGSYRCERGPPAEDLGGGHLAGLLSGHFGDPSVNGRRRTQEPEVNPQGRRMRIGSLDRRRSRSP